MYHMGVGSLIVIREGVLSRHTFSDKNKNTHPHVTHGDLVVLLLSEVCLLSRHTFSDKNKNTHPHVPHGGG